MNGRHWLLFRTSAVVLLCGGSARIVRAAKPAGPAADAEPLSALWNDLGSRDQAKVRSAMTKLAGRGDSAAAFLAGKLKPKKVALDTERIAKLIRDLDDNNFRTREKAHKELVRMGPAVVPFLREALKGKPSPEVQARAGAILAELDVQAKDSPAVLRRLRAFVVLRRIASMRALDVLKTARAEAMENDRPLIDAAILNLAERALPPLVEAAGEQARQRRFGAAAKLCAKALAIAEKADHYSRDRIQAILRYLRARQKGGQAPAKLPAELKAGAAGGNPQAAEARIGWEMARGENLLGNCGFEVKQVLGIWPTAPGVWGGDMAGAAGAQQGIKPRDGKSMLWFHHCNFRSSGSASGAQVCQVIDLTKVREAVRAGRVRAFASAFFNRVAGNARTDTAFGMSLIAYSGSPRQHFALSQRNASIGRQIARLDSDANPATWEKLAAGIRLPKNTDFLVLQLLAAENVFNDLNGVEFDGHYADSAFLTLVTDPPATAPAREQESSGGNGTP